MILSGRQIDVALIVVDCGVRADINATDGIDKVREASEVHFDVMINTNLCHVFNR